MDLSSFKTYDIRGELNVNFDNSLCFLIGRAFAQVLTASRVCVGHDSRETSSDLANSVIDGLALQGVDVLRLGLIGTEEMYNATVEYNACGGIMVTASHNPINYNGLKLVKAFSEPLDPYTELEKIKKIIEESDFEKKDHKGKIFDYSRDAKKKYIKKMLSFIDCEEFRPLRILVNAGNGSAGPTFDLIEKELEKITNKLEFIKVLHEPDSSFPHGIPNPLIKENQHFSSQEVLKSKCDLGIVFDGDFDRCFFFDNHGQFVPGELIVGLLARYFLQRYSKQKIIHDTRIYWGIEEEVNKYGGIPIKSRTGHVFIKQNMRKHNAIYGGEMSAHHYFREFSYCDSGMIPWLIVIQLISESGLSLRELVSINKDSFPSSGEINFSMKKPSKALELLKSFYQKKAAKVETLDGLSFEFEDWRFNLRASNTEPLVRLNVESKGDVDLISLKVEEIKSLISSV